MEDLEDRFEEAASVVSSGELGSLGQSELLQLYGYFCVVQRGPCSGTRPTAWQSTKRAKYDAWSAASECTREQAMERYIDLVNELQAQSGGNAASNVIDKRPLGFSMGPEDTPGSKQIDQDICMYASQGDLKSVQFCINRQKVSPDYVDEEGLTPLIRAADRGNTPVVLYLLQSSADVDLADPDGQTALHYAVQCENKDTAILLVRAGADYDRADGSGSTPLDLAPPGIRSALLSTKPDPRSLRPRSTARWAAPLAITAVLLTATALFITFHPKLSEKLRSLTQQKS